MWGTNSSSVKIPTQDRKTFAINDFSGGINNRVSPSKLKANQSPDLLNVMFEQDGTLKKRYGFNSRKIIADGEELTGHLRNVWAVTPQYREGKDVEAPTYTHKTGFILHIDQDLKFVDGNGKVTNIVTNIWKSDIEGCQFLNKFYFVTIDHEPKWDTYLYYFNFEDLKTYRTINPPGSFTPKPSPATKGELKTRPASDYSAYGLMEAWYEPCQLEMEDGFKGKNVVPSNCSLVAVHKDRIYLSGNPKDPNMVYISDIMEGAYFPASLPLQPAGNGDKVTALHSFSDGLVVARKDDIYMINGNTNRTDAGQAFSLFKINTHTGMPNHKCANIVHNFLFYLGNDGNTYKLQNYQVDKFNVSSVQTNDTVDFMANPFNKTLEELRQAHTGYNPIRGEWFIQMGDDTAVYNYLIRSWTRYNNIQNIKFLLTDEDFLFVRENLTFNKFDKNIHYDINGFGHEYKIPIDCFWSSKSIDFNSPTRIKQIRETYVVSESYEDFSSVIRIKYDVDYADVNKHYQVDNEVSRWNTAKWDLNKFVANNITRSLPMMIGRRGRTFKINISSGYRFKGEVTELPAPEFSNPGDIFYLKSGDTGIYMERHDYDLVNARFYSEVENIEAYFQPFKIYELSGIYEEKGYR